MKKHLTLAAVLGAVVLVGASFIAQANEPATSTVTTTIEKATETTTTPAAPAADKVAKDTAECAALAAAPKTDGAAPSDADKADALKKCLESKGHGAAAPAAVEGAKEGEHKAEEHKAAE